MVIKIDKQQYRNSQIGVVGADMSVANSMNQIANAMSGISNRLFKDAAENADREAREYVSSLSNDQIVGTDPNTGRPVNLLKGLTEGLSSKGYGSIGKNAFDEEITRRFANIVRNQYTEKSKRLALQHPNNPNKFQDEFAHYLDNLALPYEGKFKNIILDGGTEWGASVKTKLIGDTMENEKRISNLILARDLSEADANLESLGKETKGNNWQSMLAGIKDDKNPVNQDLKQRIGTSFAHSGGMKMPYSEYRKKMEVSYASGSLQGIFADLIADNDKGQIIGYKLSNAILGRTELTNDILGGLSKDQQEKIKGLVNIVRKNNAGAEVYSKLNGLAVADRHVDNYLESKQTDEKNDLLSDLVQSRKQSQEDIFQSFVYGADGGAISNIQKLIDSGDTDGAMAAYQEARKQLNVSGTTVLQGVDSQGNVVKDKQSVLTPDGLASVMTKFDSKIANIIATDSSSLFTESGMVNMGKMKSLMAYIANPKNTSMLNGFTSEQKSYAQKFGKYMPIENVPDALLTGKGSKAMTAEFRSRLLSKMGSNLEAQNKAVSHQASIKKYTNLARTLDPSNKTGAIIGPSSPDQRKIAGEILSNEFAPLFQASAHNKNPPTIENIWFTAHFLSPDSAFRKRVDQMANKGIVPQPLVNAIKSLSKAKEGDSSTLALWDYVKKDGGEMVTWHKKADNTYDTRVVRRRLLASNGLEQEMKFFDEVIEASKVVNSLSVGKLIADMAEFNNPIQSERLNNYYDQLFYKELKLDKYKNWTGRDIAIDQLKRATGSSYIFDFIEPALDFHVAAKRANGEDLNIKAWAKSMMSNNFYSGEDIVLDAMHLNFTGEDKTPYSLLNIFPDDDTRESFKEYVDLKLLRLSKNKVSLYGGDRGDVEGEVDPWRWEPFSSIGEFFTAWQHSDVQKKAWLVPVHGANTTPLIGLHRNDNDRNADNAGIGDIQFMVHWGRDGELEPLVLENAENDNQPEVIYVSANEFREWLNKQ